MPSGPPLHALKGKAGTVGVWPCSRSDGKPGLEVWLGSLFVGEYSSDAEALAAAKDFAENGFSNSEPSAEQAAEEAPPAPGFRR